VNFTRLLELVGDLRLRRAPRRAGEPRRPPPSALPLDESRPLDPVAARGIHPCAPLPEDQTSPLPDRQPPVACLLRQPPVGPGLLIPDMAHGVTSVTTKRPHRWQTPLGSFIFHHIKPTWLHGYRRLEVSICLRRHAGEGPAQLGLPSPACR